MGQLISIRCENCNTNKTFRIGVGMLDFNLDNILRRFNQTVKDKLEEIKQDHNIDNYIYDNIIVECDKCNEIYSQPYLVITYDNKKLIFGDTCMLCNRNVHQLEVDELRKLRCPKCLENQQMQYSGHWD